MESIETLFDAIARGEQPAPEGLDLKRLLRFCRLAVVKADGPVRTKAVTVLETVGPAKGLEVLQYFTEAPEVAVRSATLRVAISWGDAGLPVLRRAANGAARGAVWPTRRPVGEPSVQGRRRGVGRDPRACGREDGGTHHLGAAGVAAAGAAKSALQRGERASRAPRRPKRPWCRPVHSLVVRGRERGERSVESEVSERVRSPERGSPAGRLRWGWLCLFIMHMARAAQSA